MGAIYNTTGKAKEYAFLSINIFTGCTAGCVYCYCPKFLHKTPAEYHANDNPKNGIVEIVRREAPKYAGTNKRIHLSFIGDPYCRIDRDIKLTRTVLQVLKENYLPFQILTKGGTAACRDFDLYGKDDLFGTTLTFIDKKNSRTYEHSAALPADRIGAIKAAKQKGIFTWVSLEPVIDPEASLQIITETHDIVDHYKLGILNYHKIGNPNWSDYGRKALDLLHKFGSSYYVKGDLAKHLAGIEFHNTETRLT
jgi:DNA repair photolyase